MSLDKKVHAFFDSHPREWHDSNIPEIDGKLLYDIIIKNKYTKALDIGTSTGYSAIWIAWALSKTGGKLITAEYDESRHKTAVENFEKAGLLGYVDARLANARKLVPKLPGPFDFVFSDADADWYKNYFDALAPKLSVGGCFVTHDVSDYSCVRYIENLIRGLLKVAAKGRIMELRRTAFGTYSYVDYLKGIKNFETIFDNRGAGVAISYKRSEK